MKPPAPLDPQTVVRTFQAIPELVRAGALAGANALYLEHIENPRGFGRDLIDLWAIDQQRNIDWRELLARAARAADNDYKTPWSSFENSRRTPRNA